jgi:hypothetical protein
MFKRGFPLVIAILFGLLTLVSLLFAIPELSNLILGWAGFLVAVALLLGAINLLGVHTHRLFRKRPFGGQNLYSGVLVLSMLLVFALGITDLLEMTDGGLSLAFRWIQAPLEAAMASLLAFFLLVSGVYLLRRQRTVGSVLFLVTAVFILLSNALSIIPLLPPAIVGLLQQARAFVQDVIVAAGMRGILLGVALGTITLSVRLLLGLERPYNK